MDVEAAEKRSRAYFAPLLPAALAFAAGIVWDRFGEPWSTRRWAVGALLGSVVALWGRDRRILAVAGVVLALVALGGGRHHAAWSDLAADDLAWSVGSGVGEGADTDEGRDGEPRPVWVRGVVSEIRGPRAAGAGSSVGAEGIRGGERDRERDRSASTRAVLELTGICDGRAWRRAGGRAQLIVVGDRSDLQPGQGVEAVGGLAAIAGPLNPGEFDYRGHLRAQGVRLRLTVDDPEGVWLDPSARVWRGTSWLGRVRTWSYDRLVAGLDPRTAPLAAALLLGRREGVEPEVNDAFARTGTTHLLAISGLHLQVLAGVLWFGFRMVGLGRRRSFAAVAAVTAAYAVLVGLAPSVVRSAVMTLAACWAGVRDRQIRSANNLALAAVVTLALNPSDLFDVGCQLSFLAIAAIFWGVAPASKLLGHLYYALTFRFQGPGSPLDALERSLEPWWLSRMRRWPLLVSSGLIVSSVVWLAALPLVAYRFHLVSPIAVVLNIPLIPITSGALMASGLSLGLSAIWEPLGRPAAWVCGLALSCTETLVRWGASQSWGHWFVPGPSWEWVVVVYALLALATAAGVRRWPLRRTAWSLLAGWVGLGLLWPWLAPRPARPEVELLAVGHGLAIVIQTGAETILYDCGRMHDPSVGRRIVAPALWARGVDRLAAVVLSHADADHYNGLPDLLERFPIGEVLVPPGFAGPANPGAVQLLDAVRARGVPVRTLVEGDQWESGGVRLSVWHPPRSFSLYSSDNARSLVVDVEFADRHVLLTGDLEQEGLSRLVERPAFPLDAILAPHHGGRTANPEWLYAWARPDLVVVSQRPPSPGARDFLDILAARGIPLFRTWRRGAVRLRWEPDRLSAQGFLDRSL